VILVDTSVWVDHLRATDSGLSELLGRGRVLIHPHVIGELALGNLHPRDMVLNDLRNLPSAVIADDGEVLDMIARHRLHGLGIGYTDAHLIAATLLTPDASLWTRDARLAAVARRLGKAFSATS
jgi:hypothetical protein